MNTIFKTKTVTEVATGVWTAPDWGGAIALLKFVERLDGKRIGVRLQFGTQFEATCQGFSNDDLRDLAKFLMDLADHLDANPQCDD